MKVIIVGGVAGGASAAARLRRLDEFAEITLFERGPHISYANCGLPYYIGGVIREQDDLLLQTPDAFFQRFRVDVQVNMEVTAIDRGEKTVTARHMETGAEITVPYDKLILSPGARAFSPPIPGLDLPKVYTLRTVGDSEIIRQAAGQRGKTRAAIIGGGFIGVETAENLIHRGVQVTVIEAMPQVLSQFDREMAGILQRTLAANGVSLKLGSAVEAVEDRGDWYTVRLAGGEQVDCEFVISAIGVRPEGELAAQAGLTTNRIGAIVTDPSLRTEDPDIYAVGDAIETENRVTGKRGHLPLAGPANRQGRMAAGNAAGGKETFSGVLGSSVLKLFELTAACTGVNEQRLQQEQIPYEKVYLLPPSHATYYPGGATLILKVLFSPGDGKLLGAQCIGSSGVEKQIDSIATALHFGGTVRDLAELEFCYAPPYSSAKTPVNMAGFMGENVLDGSSRLKYWNDLETLRGEGTLFPDVRTAGEYRQGHLPGSVNIPLDSMRERIREIESGRPILVYCGVGMRGYLAQRILLQRGFSEVYNLSGGYAFLQIAGLV